MTQTNYKLVEHDVAVLRPYARNARTHSKKQIKQIAASIERFGFTNPVLVSDDLEIIAGHGRVSSPSEQAAWRSKVDNAFAEQPVIKAAEFRCHTPPSPQTLVLTGTIRLDRERTLFDGIPEIAEFRGSAGSKFIEGSGRLMGGVYQFQVACVTSEPMNLPLKSHFGFVSLVFKVRTKPDQATLDALVRPNDRLQLERRYTTLKLLRDQEYRRLEQFQRSFKFAVANSRIMSADVANCSPAVQKAALVEAAERLWDFGRLVPWGTPAIVKVVDKTERLLFASRSRLQAAAARSLATIAARAAAPVATAVAVKEIVARGYCVQQVYSSLAPRNDEVSNTIEAINQINVQIRLLEARLVSESK